MSDTLSNRLRVCNCSNLLLHTASVYEGVCPGSNRDILAAGAVFLQEPHTRKRPLGDRTNGFKCGALRKLVLQGSTSIRRHCVVPLRSKPKLPTAHAEHTHIPVVTDSLHMFSSLRRSVQVNRRRLHRSRSKVRLLLFSYSFLSLSYWCSVLCQFMGLSSVCAAC
jgi:hypothetical protein